MAADASGVELTSITQFLDESRSRESRCRPPSTALIELGFDSDSNINSVISAGQVACLPVGLVVASGQAGERQSNLVTNAAAGIQGVYPVAPGVSLYGGGQVSARYNAKSNNGVFFKRKLLSKGSLGVARS